MGVTGVEPFCGTRNMPMCGLYTIRPSNQPDVCRWHLIGPHVCVVVSPASQRVILGAHIGDHTACDESPQNGHMCVVRWDSRFICPLRHTWLLDDLFTRRGLRASMSATSNRPVFRSSRLIGALRETLAPGRALGSVRIVRTLSFGHSPRLRIAANQIFNELNVY